MAVKEKYIDPFTYFGFKKLFGTELNKDLLIDFLNNVILPEKKQIIDLQYKKTDQYGHSVQQRGAIFDLACESKTGERFIVEMQKAKQDYFKDRTVFYSTFPIQDQAPKGTWNFKLSEVYTVGILDFVFEEDKFLKEVRHEIKLKDQNCNVFYDKLTFIYLEMPNFTKTEDELETIYDKWLYVLKQLPYLEKRPKKLQEKVFERLFRVAEIAKFSQNERDSYEESVKVYRDNYNTMEYALREAETKGESTGMIRGEIKGEISGKIKGEIKAKNDGIINLLQMKILTVEQIAQAFEVTLDFVLNLKKENNL